MKKQTLISMMALGCALAISHHAGAFTCVTPTMGWVLMTQAQMLPHDVKINPCIVEECCSHTELNPTCCAPTGSPRVTGQPDFAPPGLLSMWIDPGMTAATAADAAVTYFQHKKTIKMTDALTDLKSLLEAADKKAVADSEKSLKAKEMDLLAPEMVIKELQDDSSSFEDIRQAVEAETFQTSGCTRDCSLEKQSAWLLTSVELALSIADKVVVHTDDMADYFQALADDFNRTTPIQLRQNDDNTGTDGAGYENKGDLSGAAATAVNTQSPKIMWQHMAAITVDTLTQVNDLNVLYARDLEMHGLAGIYESGTQKISRSKAGES